MIESWNLVEQVQGGRHRQWIQRVGKERGKHGHEHACQCCHYGDLFQIPSHPRRLQAIKMKCEHFKKLTIETAVRGGGTLLLRLPRVALVTTSRDVN
jgi:hypothetical protein